MDLLLAVIVVLLVVILGALLGIASRLANIQDNMGVWVHAILNALDKK